MKSHLKKSKGETVAYQIFQRDAELAISRMINNFLGILELVLSCIAPPMILTGEMPVEDNLKVHDSLTLRWWWRSQGERDSLFKPAPFDSGLWRSRAVQPIPEGRWRIV